MAVPITCILVCQAGIDFHELRYEKHKAMRIFYCLDNPLKKAWVYGNIVATAIYCCCLFRWLWIIQNNAHNNNGRLQDAEALHLSLGSFIFYTLFLIERVGMFILNTFHS